MKNYIRQLPEVNEDKAAAKAIIDTTLIFAAASAFAFTLTEIGGQLTNTGKIEMEQVDFDSPNP